MVIDEPGLDRPSNYYTFAEYFKEPSNSKIMTFSNLGNDAILIVPKPETDHSIYSHLANFVRSRAVDQQQEMWRTVGKSLLQKLSAKPVWLNTAGLGVSWLHIRLDDYPKYYIFEPYR